MVVLLLVIALVGTLLLAGTQRQAVIRAKSHARAREKEWSRRLAAVKQGAMDEIRREHARRVQERDSLLDGRRREQEAAAARESQLTARVLELAARPPVVQPTPDLSALVESVGRAVQSVAYGPERPVQTPEQLDAAIYNPLGALNESLGAPTGDWMPDVEMDEWMEEYGVPNRPGWVAGTGMPMMQASPDLPQGIVEVQRANGDAAKYASGQSGPMPTGGVE